MEVATTLLGLKILNSAFVVPIAMVPMLILGAIYLISFRFEWMLRRRSAKVFVSLAGLVFYVFISVSLLKLYWTQDGVSPSSLARDQFRMATAFVLLFFTHIYVLFCAATHRD